MEPIDFDEYVDVLRECIFDYEAVHNDGTIPKLDELSRHSRLAGGSDHLRTYQDITTNRSLPPH